MSRMDGKKTHTHKKDPSLMNAFQKRNFKLLVGTHQTKITNGTKMGKIVSVADILLLLKSQTIFQSHTIRRYISIRSTKVTFSFPALLVTTY